jgi:dipeptidase E
MKLLLTSAGITTQAIADTLNDLIGDGNRKIGFIPTAANMEPGNKDWFINQFVNLRKYGFDWIDCIDPSAAGIDWRARLREVGVVFVSGGNTFHLLNQARLTGFGDWLHEHGESIVYVGVSAGSIIMTPSIGIAPVDNGDENTVGIDDVTGLKFVDFEVSPHTPEAVSLQANKQYVTTIRNKLYAYNDSAALRVVDGAVEKVPGGQYWEFN